MADKEERDLKVARILPAYQQVAEQLKTKIMSGELTVGTRLPVENELAATFGVSRSTAREALRLLLSREAPPTAVICGAEPFAYGVLFEAQAQGIRVPKDLSVTGFDDIWLSAQITPSLTTVRTPRREMGRLAGRYLLSILAGKETVLPRPLDVELIVRQSTCPPLPDTVGKEGAT